MITVPGTPGSETPSQISHDLLSVMRLSSTPPTRYLMLKVAYIPQTNEQPLGGAGSLGTDELEDCHRDKQGVFYTNTEYT